MRTLYYGLLALVLALPVFTQAAEDAPSRVARLSFLEGDVSMAPAGTQEWGDAVLNRPLTSEDRLYVGNGARAELQIGSATVHLDSSTEFAFLDLDDDALTMKLTEGRATIRIVRKRNNEAIEVNTPNASVALLHPGEYTIEVNDDGDATVVRARSGEAEVAGEEKSYTVRANEEGVFRGTEDLDADVSRLGPRTAFEDWANERARRNERSASSRYVGEGVIGYEDLDDQGEWISEPEYGYVWRPTYVVAGWAPYRFGRWAWISPWGWTWIDDARWGFAPFHYGRWAYVRHRWCWVPGPRHIHAVYAPALVAWTGGPHVSVSVSIGSGIGWFPLGPREVYVPGYWHSRRYIHNVNVSNTIIVNNTYITNAYRGRYRDFDYRYRHQPDAVTVVDREHFVHGRPVGQSFARVSDRDLRNWRHDARPPAIAPERDSLRASQPRAPRAAEHERALRPVVARREPARRVDFDAERRAIEANGGRPVARTRLLDRNAERDDVRVARSRGESGFSPRSARTEGMGERSPRAREQAEAGRGPSIQSGEPRVTGEREARRERVQRNRQLEAAPSEREQVRSAPEVRNEARRSESGAPPEVIEGRSRRDSRADDGSRERVFRSESAPQTAEQPQREWSRGRVERAEPRERYEQPQRVERQYSPPARVERQERSAPAPRFERSAPEPRSEPRSAPAPRSMPQPRSESPSDSGRSGNHTRVERGHPANARER